MIPAAFKQVARASAAALAVASGPNRARAEPFLVDRAWVAQVGLSPGAALQDRIDGARTGRSATSLGGPGLRTAWQVALGAPIDRPPLVGADNTVIVVTTAGEVLALASDGSELWRTSTGALQPSAGAWLADGTIVLVGENGEAVGVRAGVVRFRTRFGRSGGPVPSPLALLDGGAAVATTREIAVLDAHGRIRSRVLLPEPIAAPLLAAEGRLVVAGLSGTVWTWAPGAADAERRGSFGTAVEPLVVQARAAEFLAVAAGGSRLVRIGLGEGTATTLAAAGDGHWLGAPASREGHVYALLSAAHGDFAVALGPDGSELGRALLGAGSRRLGADPADVDASAPIQSAAEPSPGPLVGPGGELVFGLPTGAIAVVARLESNDPAVDRMDDACSGRAGSGSASASAIAGLAPLPPSGVVVTCRSGRVVGLRPR